jgi:hypothetical protein
MRRYQRLAILLSMTLLLVISVAAKLKGDDLTITVKTCDYQITDGDRGQRIEMEGYGYMMEPGKPMLPAKNFLIALPPGARVQSVQVKGIGATQLPGTYRIQPSPLIMPLVDPGRYSQLVEKMQREWQRNNKVIYGTDQVYPQERGKLNSSGSLRKHSYASVSFCPFSYHPQSGRLVYCDAAHFTISYSLPSPGSSEAQRVEELKWDTTADERASQLFVNYQQVKELYQPSGVQADDSLEIYDYVFITTSDLYDAISSSEFFSWKTSLGYNIKIVLVTDPEISNQPGDDLPEQIRNFLKQYYISWGIEYVLIVGNHATIPMRYCYPDSTNHRFDIFDGTSGEVPTDYYYADLSNDDSVSWDSDGDGYYGEFGEDNPDFLTEVYIGRIPTNILSRITYTLNKLVTFEQDTGDWKNHALHAGAFFYFTNEDHSGYPAMDGAVISYYIEQDIMEAWTISHYSEQTGLETSIYDWPGLNETSFINDWRTGQYAIVNWQGHGWTDGVARKVWSSDDGDGVPEGNEISWPYFITINSNLDDDYPSVVTAVSCYVGCPEPAPSGNLGIDLLTDPSSGASIGVVASARSPYGSLDWPNNLGGSESIIYEFNRYMINESKKVGEALYDSKFFCNYTYGWNHRYEYVNMFTYNLYGDPSLAREGIPVGIETESLTELPSSFLLAQNCPNPFNPTTQITYALPKQCLVRLDVYNMLGQRVATVVDGEQKAGYKSATWNASSLSSGIYFYRLQAGDFVQTRKMVLIR